MSIFTKVSVPKVGRSRFNLSEGAKLSCNFGDLIPICCKEIFPGDRLKISTELAIKAAPLASPAMHNINAYVHYFFVPLTQITDVFEKFINPKVNKDNDIILPTWTPYDITNRGFSDSPLELGGLADYLGLPVQQSSWRTLSQKPLSVLPFMAYQHIYNSYYRDQNMEVLEDADPSTTSLFLVDQFKNVQGSIASQNGNQIHNLFKLRKRAWAKDYFTSALPSPQAGDDVLIPVTGRIEADGPLTLGDSESSTFAGGASWKAGYRIGDNFLTDVGGDVSAIYKSGLKSVNAESTINDLRKAFALQRFKELAERGGTRYSEMVNNFFQEHLPDWYVDRPIFLGGSKQPIVIGEVLQTSATSGESALGARAGEAHSYGFVKSSKLKSPMHGFLIGILSIRPVAEYFQGVERMWTRESMYDYPFPQFAHLGEQEIHQSELFVDGDDSRFDTVFGYTPRYADWKEGHTHICGEFRTSLDYWHFARKFQNAPQLSKEFIQMDSVRYDPFLVVDGQTEHFYVQLYNHIHGTRKLPYFGSPSII